MAYRSVQEAEAWAKAHPTKNVGGGGPSWAGWCAALMYWAGNFDRSCDTATEGSRQSGMVSSDSSVAPRGALHWWRMGSDGHVALDLDGGGGRLLMASSAVSNFGQGIGTISWAAYSGTAYAGWSIDFVGQRLSDVGVRPVIQPPNERTSGLILQRLGQRGGYSGPMDGVPGPNSWRGVQNVLRQFGYTGPIDGIPGPNTFRALQQLAQSAGYTGPIDGVPGPNTYAGVSRWLG
jgi:hypothetical protein